MNLSNNNIIIIIFCVFLQELKASQQRTTGRCCPGLRSSWGEGSQLAPKWWKTPLSRTLWSRWVRAARWLKAVIHNFIQHSTHTITAWDRATAQALMCSCHHSPEIPGACGVQGAALHGAAWGAAAPPAAQDALQDQVRRCRGKRATCRPKMSPITEHNYYREYILFLTIPYWTMMFFSVLWYIFS